MVASRAARAPHRHPWGVAAADPFDDHTDGAPRAPNALLLRRPLPNGYADGACAAARGHRRGRRYAHPRLPERVVVGPRAARRRSQPGGVVQQRAAGTTASAPTVRQCECC